jgi:hypothetical protein
MTTAVVVLSSPTVLSRHIVAGIVTRNADFVRRLAVAPSVTASIRMMPGDSSTDRALV